ncbi:MAG: UDP-3-O-(3-hydroxymyristoyl)glucosamine N-acyltransferase [Pseudomonadota bacterium]
MQARSLGELAAFLDARLVGDPAVQVHALAAIQSAGPGTLAFVANPKYQAHLEATQAAAVILAEPLLDKCPCAALVVKNPYLAYAKVSHLFSTLPNPAPGVHPTAVIADGVQVPATAHVGPHAVIESGVVIGDAAVIGAHCTIGAGSRLGAQVRLWPNVTIYPGVTIGQRTIIHAGSVIGADGFGFAPDAGKWQKIAQVGGVTIGDDVEIGALCTIDRGAIGDTLIGNGVILDDQVHIAHNVSVGDYTAMAGKAGVSGSTTIGKHCLISGMAGLVGHIEICDNVQISGMTVVSKSITEPGVYTSGTGMEEHSSWMRNAARFRQLDAMARRLAELEKRLQAIEGK